MLSDSTGTVDGRRLLPEALGGFGGFGRRALGGGGLGRDPFINQQAKKGK